MIRSSVAVAFVLAISTSSVFAQQSTGSTATGSDTQGESPALTGPAAAPSFNTGTTTQGSPAADSKKASSVTKGSQGDIKVTPAGQVLAPKP